MTAPERKKEKMKKWIKYLLAVLYELGVGTAVYFIVKYFAEKVV